MRIYKYIDGNYLAYLNIFYLTLQNFRIYTGCVLHMFFIYCIEKLAKIKVNGIAATKLKKVI